MPADPRSIAIDLSRDDLFDPFGLATVKERYLVGDETSPQHAIARASAAFADDEAHAQRIYEYASKHWFMFATPLLANGGTTRGLPISCFLNWVPDSREGILNHYTENGWLASMGGGIGSHWGELRSVGTKTSKGSKTSGVVPFARVVDAQMLAFHQGGTRRGSAAVYLPISHPEIEEWIVMRKVTGGDFNRKTPNLHHAVSIPDAFMQAVEADLPWDLIDPHSKEIRKTVSARHLWRLILETRMELGEPYIFFEDTANRALPKPLKDIGLRIYSSNLCTEIMLPTGPDPRNGKMRTAVCCLSSTNLLHFKEWSQEPLFIPDLMRMLDNVLTDYIQRAPASHAAAVYSASQERSVGLGAMGFHSFLQRNRIAIESDVARAWNVMMFEHIREQADAASLELGAERGEAPDMAGTGERFAHKLAIAPNASSSIICGNVSPSIEPVPANAYGQKTLSGLNIRWNPECLRLLEEKGMNTPEIAKSIVTRNGSVQHLEGLSDHEKAVFLTSDEIDQKALVRLAGDRAGFIDQGQSVNLFFPPDARAKELHDTHILAWKLGVKSLYYLRPSALKRAELSALRTERAAAPIALATGPAEIECLSCEG
ncbi:ribonucleoside-diphosphate reductase subunit alpha [Microcystis phage Mwe-JY26]